MGRLVEEKSFNNDGLILWQYKHRYDSRGRLSESLGTHDRFVFLPDKETYIYDSAGNLILVNGVDSRGKLVNKSEYAYDEKRRKIRWMSMSYHPEEHSKPHQWTYTYYENGLVKEERAFVDNGEGFHSTDSLGGAHHKFYFYDSYQKPSVVMFYNTNGALAGLKSTTYDERGNEREESQYESTGVLKNKTKYRYKFDKYGNTLEQKTYEFDLQTGMYYLSEISFSIIKYAKKTHLTHRSPGRGRRLR